MKLISDIINELVDVNVSITSPLLKTKVLASRLDNSDLLKWVGDEIEGYGSTEDLPHYRIYASNVIGDYINFDKHHKNSPIPTSGLGEELEEFMVKMKFQQSVASLEKQLEDNKSGSLEFSFPAEIVGFTQANWRKMGNPYLQLLNVRKTVSVNANQEIISVVRNRLLDFMLKIDNEFGSNTEIEELKTKKEIIKQFMSQTIINNTGDGNVVNTGDNAEVSATITINKGNKDELKALLEKNGIEEPEVAELLEIIDSEEPDKSSGRFGEKVNNWTKKMMGKALDGTWNVGIGAAGSLLAEAIKSYYGM